MIGENWELEQPWAWSLDTMIGGPQDDGVWRGKVPDVEVTNLPDGEADYPPRVEGERVIVGPWWWDTHSVEERRQALMDAIGGSDYV